MNKLVKRLTGILAAGLMLMAAGCGGRPQEPEQSTPEITSAPPALPEAFALYEGAAEKLESVKNVACSLEMEMIQSSAGTTITVPVKAKIEAQEKEGVTLLHMLINMSMMGQTINMEMWQDGEYTYTSAYGQKTKELVTEDTNSQISEDELKKLEDSLSASMKENATVTAQEDGGYLVTSSIPGKEIAGLMEKTMGMAGSGDLESIDGLTFANVELGLTFDKDQMIRKMTMKGGMEGETEVPDINDPEKTVKNKMTLSFDATVSLDKYGADVTVTLPEDLDAYQEMSGIEDEDMVDEIVESLFDENGNYVENFDEVYDQLAARYGADAVDQVLALILGNIEV